MDKSLESFLHPKRKPNVKFRMNGFQEEFEMQSITGKQGLEIDRDIQARGLTGASSIVPYVSESLVKPNLHDAELLAALSEKAGHKILSAYDAAVELFTDAELATLSQVYSDHVRTTATLNEDIETAKNA